MMRSHWIRADVDGGVEFTHSGNNIITQFEISAHPACGMSFNLKCPKQHSDRVSQALRENPVLRANVSNITTGTQSNHWSFFNMNTRTIFLHHNPRPEETNALLDVINQLEPNMENMDAVREIVANHPFTPQPSQHAGKAWNYFTG